MASQFRVHPVTSRFRRKCVEGWARLHGVTPERFIEVVQARKAYRNGKYRRKVQRATTLKRNPKAKRRVGILRKAIFSGEGEFDNLLKQLNWTHDDFAEYAGMSRTTVSGWTGHPLHKWPVKMMELILTVRSMSALLEKQGFDPAAHWKIPQLPQEKRGKSHPRKKGTFRIDGKLLADYSPFDDKG